MGEINVFLYRRVLCYKSGAFVRILSIAQKGNYQGQVGAITGSPCSKELVHRGSENRVMDVYMYISPSSPSPFFIVR